MQRELSDLQAMALEAEAELHRASPAARQSAFLAYQAARRQYELAAACQRPSPLRRLLDSLLYH